MNTRVRPPDAPATAAPAAPWLEMPGDIAAQLRDRDWSKHPLGWPGSWPSDLRAAVQLMLSSNIPAILFWGETRIQLFNDAFAATLEGDAANAALAVPAAQANLPLWRR